MGITGLIPFLEKASRKVHLNDLRGCTVAVDTYCWLHKGVFSCAEKLVRGEETALYVQYCLKMVHMLLSYDIKPILVYDGRHLPAKALTEKRRRESRQQSKKRAAELLRLGRIDEARSHMRRCVDVTHEMALRLIRECRELNVDCIVAPYEADAQMAWFNKVDVAQYVITEDSDLTLFGARNVIFKLDLAGVGLLVESDKFYLAMGCRKEQFTFEKYRRMCILSGCDYLDSLPGIGLARACKFLLKTEENDMWRALKKIPQYLNMRQLEVTDEYIENFLKAEATFKHMFIFNPFKRRMERLHELQEFETDERYCSNAGVLLDKEQAFHLALGNLNPFSLKELDKWHPDRHHDLAQTASKNVQRTRHKSIWQANFEAHTITEYKKKLEPFELKACGIYFKKIDFSCKSVDDEVNANIKEEQDKPSEEDVFSMYKNEVLEGGAELCLKRRRPSTRSSVDEDEKFCPVTVHVRHNPFAVAAENNIVPTSSKICENNSLLRIFSPKNNVLMQESVRTLKSSIFTNDEKLEQTPMNIEVKSRFFAANVKQASQTQTLTQQCEISPKDLTNEINRIESLSQQTQENQQHLYNHCTPSPKKHKTITYEEEQTAQTLPSESPALDECLGGINGRKVETSVDNCSQRSQQTNDTESIVLSDDDYDDFDLKALDVSKMKTLEICKFQPQRAPRLGLSNPKKTISKNKSSSRNSVSASGRLEANQTLLSKFGFQKRPKLN